MRFDDTDIRRRNPVMMVDKSCPGVMARRCQSFAVARLIVADRGGKVVSVDGCVMTYELPVTQLSFVPQPIKDQSWQHATALGSRQH